MRALRFYQGLRSSPEKDTADIMMMHDPVDRAEDKIKIGASYLTKEQIEAEIVRTQEEIKTIEQKIEEAKEIKRAIEQESPPSPKVKENGAQLEQVVKMLGAED